MVYYFSGTGNSLYAAKKIAAYINEPLMNISVAIKADTAQLHIPEGERIGFVFPLFAWSAPQMVFDFAKRIRLENRYIFAVATYGQNIGRFDRFFEKAGIGLNSAFSLNMPNNYMTIWDEEKQSKCLADAEKRLETISDAILNRQNVRDIQCVRGGAPVTEDEVSFAADMNARWSSTLHDVSAFYVTDACVGCGLCEKVCNGQTIQLVNGKPVWGENCTKCLACLHLCPKRAIQFGRETEGAGRYKNPNISVTELIISKDKAL